MCDENKKEKKAKIFSCCGCDGITEMMKGCFPDDAGFTTCLAKINEGREKFCGKNAEAAASIKRRAFAVN